jgi:AbrB family looped-hinge helix DNA binding protein
LQTKVSSKGQVVIPRPIRHRLGIRAGDSLNANIEAGRIVLTPLRKRLHRVSIIADPITGLPVLSAGLDAPVLSSKEVEDILVNFP